MGPFQRPLLAERPKMASWAALLITEAASAPSVVAAAGRGWRFCVVAIAAAAVAIGAQSCGEPRLEHGSPPAGGRCADGRFDADDVRGGGHGDVVCFMMFAHHPAKYIGICVSE